MLLLNSFKEIYFFFNYENHISSFITGGFNSYRVFHGEPLTLKINLLGTGDG